MSLKAIEMQVALPRTMDAGKIQDQLQRSQLVTGQVGESVKEDTDLLQNSVMKNEHSNEGRFYKNKPGEQPTKQGKSRKKPKGGTGQEEHPYKGTIIDYSG
nr:hypothetical protein [uncultured Bacillus sp.]